jgi:hypothetical protein
MTDDCFSTLFLFLSQSLTFCQCGLSHAAYSTSSDCQDTPWFYMAGTIDDFPILLRLVYILVACTMFDHVFFLIHTFKNSAGDGAR